MKKEDLKIGDSFIINKNFLGAREFIGKKQIVSKTDANGVYFSSNIRKHDQFCYFTSIDLIQDNGNYEIY